MKQKFCVIDRIVSWNISCFFFLFLFLNLLNATQNRPLNAVCCSNSFFEKDHHKEAFQQQVQHFSQMRSALSAWKGLCVFRDLLWSRSSFHAQKMMKFPKRKWSSIWNASPAPNKGTRRTISEFFSILPRLCRLKQREGPVGADINFAMGFMEFMEESIDSRVMQFIREEWVSGYLLRKTEPHSCWRGRNLCWFSKSLGWKVSS